MTPMGSPVLPKRGRGVNGYDPPCTYVHRPHSCGILGYMCGKGAYYYFTTSFLIPTRTRNVECGIWIWIPCACENVNSKWNTHRGLIADFIPYLSLSLIISIFYWRLSLTLEFSSLVGLVIVINTFIGWDKICYANKYCVFLVCMSTSHL